MSADDDEVVNYLVRMVIPMRREFGRKLDVGQFRIDAGYASEVLEQARKSLDPRLRDYGFHVEQRLLGARGSGLAAPPPVRQTLPAPPAGAAVTASVAPASRSATAGTAAEVDKAAEDALRAKVMKKYTSGLR